MQELLLKKPGLCPFGGNDPVYLSVLLKQCYLFYPFFLIRFKHRYL